MRGLGDSNLLRLWRQAVLKSWDGKCFFCQNENEQEIECHHTPSKRRHKLTRYLAQNGIPVCSMNWKTGISCHQYADTREGEEKIKQAIGEDKWFEIDRLARQTIKGYCQREGITVNEYLLERKKELEKIIKGVGKDGR
jgi:hypothetical protein